MVRNPDTLRQICADRPDLVQYLESLLTEATTTPVLHPGAAPSNAVEAVAFSNCHVRWRAFIGKAHPHLERCQKWHLEENVTPLPDTANAPTPESTWTDEGLSLNIVAAEGGDLNISAQWHYGPPQGGLDYNCQLRVEGWDLILNVNWLKRTLYTMFYHEPQITVIRAATDDSGEMGHDEALDHAENIGGLG